MTEPIWVRRDVVLASHREMISTHGGSAGIRDEGLLDSALARPENLYVYDENSDLFTLAAAYAFGIVKNHAFIDGNKRAAFLTAYVFLLRNGIEMNATEADATKQTLALARGEKSQEDYADWLRSHSEEFD